MPHAIWFKDSLGTEWVRAQLRDAHIAYMRGNLHRTLAISRIA